VDDTRAEHPRPPQSSGPQHAVPSLPLTHKGGIPYTPAHLKQVLITEIHGREAGVRTSLLVSLGSALIMVVSEFLSVKYQDGPFREVLRGDPGRIAAQAITGIGFLGAGVILRYKESIRGLTTAACMWVVCAIGLCVGAGYYLFSIAVSAIALISLIGLKRWEKKDQQGLVSRDGGDFLSLFRARYA